MQWLVRSLAVLALAAFATFGAAAAQELTGADRQEFQRVIAGQIEAFRADDGPAAYGYAAPAIKKIFPSPEIFMEMVRNGYRPVYRPRSFHIRRHHRRNEWPPDPAGNYHRRQWKSLDCSLRI